MSTMTTLERSLSCTSSTSLSMSSPRLSVRRETTPPASASDLSLTHLHDRMNQLDSRVLELRHTFLTQDGYVDRRNREDEHIRREFDAHRAISHRIDLNVVALRSDVDQIKTSIFHLKSSIGQAGTETVFLRSDVDRLQKSVDQLQTDAERMRADICASRIDISKLQSATNQLRTDLLNLEHKISRQVSSLESHMNIRMDSMESHMNTRMDTMESRMKQSDRVRFNSLAHTVHAPISPVPVILDDGSLEWPQYFPRTVWRFWCLKKRSRVHRLVELADFYQLGGYQDWCRMHPTSMFADDSDSSDSSDRSFNITRAEAVAQYPEAAHQALAATLGLVYYKIRNEVGEGPNGLIAPRPPKRQQDDIASNSTSTKSKPVKMPRRPSVSESFLHRLITGGPTVESKSSISDQSDRLGWNPFNEVSDDAMNKLRSIDPDDIGMVLRALEQGRLKLKPSGSEKLNMSPTESKASHPLGKAAEPAQEVATIPNTVPTQPASSSSKPTSASKVPPVPAPDITPTASDADDSSTS
ncbi:uncharacterized protein N7459_002933 [Penicillium hispanicum]|uniref:uncharacterized protein n=1 Tax=Penicillium hispanicum TaxID=1080232 RepID=UPI002541F3C7|nr:uncharacterized protein N7459_002933 [Penicillium hispanicum]KAJ5587168.1 hypothetical protein N7459_002933 [Penicillium hispanicum]